jgi:hypothetical protein
MSFMIDLPTDVQQRRATRTAAAEPAPTSAHQARSACGGRGPASAAASSRWWRSSAWLHAYLRRVAAGSRARFKVALEQVALHEGLLLPVPAR